MLRVRVDGSQVRIGRHFSVSFERTLRIPDDGSTYPLPPSLGEFPVRRVCDYADRVPESWLEHGGVFLPMYQREAMWLSFNAPHWRPCAVQVGVGKVNVISGRPWGGQLEAQRQNYVVCPDQPWLDGINAGHGMIRQFVAMPLGMGYTVEGQVTGKEEFGGLQVAVFDPRPGRFPTQPPRVRHRGGDHFSVCGPVRYSECSPEMGLAAGGRMRQKIYPDTYGIDSWDPANTGRVFVHLVNSMAWREITGEEPPATPVSARSYSEHGLPWFDLYDEIEGDVSPAPELVAVKPVKAIDAEKQFGAQQDDGSVAISTVHVAMLDTAEDGATVDTP